ncbi:MAG: hypothetical protein R3C60_13235 [Parvularculaceae bacterium]
MTGDSEENYAARIGRSMWRVAKRRAFGGAAPVAEFVQSGAGVKDDVKRAAFAASPENKARRLQELQQQSADGAKPAPTSLREFLKKLAEELAQDDQRQNGS